MGIIRHSSRIIHVFINLNRCLSWFISAWAMWGESSCYCISIVPEPRYLDEIPMCAKKSTVPVTVISRPIPHSSAVHRLHNSYTCARTTISLYFVYFIYRLCNFNLFNIMILLSFTLFITYTHCTLWTVFRAYRLGTYYIYNVYMIPGITYRLHVLDITDLKSIIMLL